MFPKYDEPFKISSFLPLAMALIDKVSEMAHGVAKEPIPCSVKNPKPCRSPSR